MKIEIEQSEYDTLIAFKASNSDAGQTIDDQKGEIVKLKSDNETLTTENEKLGKVEGDFAKYKKEVDDKVKADLETDAETFVNAAIKDGRIKSKYKATYVEDFIAKAEKSEEALATFKEDIDSRDKVVNLSQKLVDDDTGEVNLTHVDYNDPDAVEEAVQTVMKRDNISWTDAEKIVTGEGTN